MRPGKRTRPSSAFLRLLGQPLLPRKWGTMSPTQGKSILEPRVPITPQISLLRHQVTLATHSLPLAATILCDSQVCMDLDKNRVPLDTMIWVLQLPTLMPRPQLQVSLQRLRVNQHKPQAVHHVPERHVNSASTQSKRRPRSECCDHKLTI